MGYYTQFSLRTEPANALAITALRSLNRNAEYALNLDGSTCQETKWYTHEKDLTELSQDFPETLFILDGIGEEPAEDIWRLYVRNGQSQKEMAVMTYAPPTV